MFNFMSAWLEAARFGSDVQRVIALRMMRLAGGGTLAASEARRMTSEKMFALGEAQAALLSALATGDGSGAAAKLYAPYRRRVRANRRRLGG